MDIEKKKSIKRVGAGCFLILIVIGMVLGILRSRSLDEGDTVDSGSAVLYEHIPAETADVVSGPPPIIEDVPVPEYEGYGDIYVSIEGGRTVKQLPLFFKAKQVYAFLPSYVQADMLSLEFDSTEYLLEINHTYLKNGSSLSGIGFETNCVFSIQARNGVPAQIASYPYYSLTIIKSENLPALYVDTENGTMDYVNQSKANYEPGVLECINADGSIGQDATIEKIHLRGSSSAALPQKGYTIRLTKAAGLCGMAAATKWCLISNGFDATHIRNALAYSYARDIGLPYAIDYRFVDVYFNGTYNGNYILCEAIEVADGRMDAQDVSALIKIDRLGENPVYFHTDASPMGTVEIPYASENTAEYYQMLRDKFDEAFSMARECDNPEDYKRVQLSFDMETLAKRYLINFIADEPDQNALSTYYFYKNSTRKWYSGPVWDFDRGFENEEGNRGRLYSINAYGNGPAEELIDYKEFAEYVREIYLKYQTAGERLLFNIDLYSEYISQSRKMTRLRFGDQSLYGMVERGNDEENILYLKRYAEKRLALMEDTILYPQSYHRITIGSYILWVKEGESLSEDMETVLCQAYGWEYLSYINGIPFRNDEPITTDLTLIGYAKPTEEAAEDNDETINSTTLVDQEPQEDVSTPSSSRWRLLEIMAVVLPAVLTVCFSVKYIAFSRRTPTYRSR